MKQIYSLKEINSLKIDIIKPCVIFLKGDLWAGKTTFSKYIIWEILWVTEDITSPTFTYYNKYKSDIYHFDLYRLQKYDEFFAIWWEEILDNNTWVILIEWPEIIESYYQPDITIILNKAEKDDQREINILTR